MPYLFSDDEVRRIFEAADSLQLSHNAKSNVELPMLLRMLYSCGFGLSELLAVRVGDINFGRGFVLLKTTKRQKQRIVPFSDTLTKMLNRYCLAMDLMGSPENYIFQRHTPEQMPDRVHIQNTSGEYWNLYPPWYSDQRPLSALFPAPLCHKILCSGGTGRTPGE